jgi:Delta7-sterol 5-desaturase
MFDKTAFQHPKYLKDQVKKEISQAVRAIPGMSLLTALCMLAEVRGYAKLYDLPSEAPFAWYNVLQFPFFLLFTDCLIYFIHRGLHHPRVYKTLHKPHHKWIVPTPYASHAFHPLDGFAQSIPYHLFPFLFPLQKFAYIALFVFINVWTIFIHDGEYYSNNPVINGSACHTMHHLYFNYNYGRKLLRFLIPCTADSLDRIHDVMGQIGRQLPQAKRGAVQEGNQNGQEGMGATEQRDGEDR